PRDPSRIPPWSSDCTRALRQHALQRALTRRQIAPRKSGPDKWCTLKAMATVSESWTPLFDAFRSLRTAWPKHGWSWDGRLTCISSSFNVEVETSARAAAAIALPAEFTPLTIHKAPAALQDLAERTGGLRAGQLLLGSAQ